MNSEQAMGKEPAARGRGKRSCPSCELECRKNEWPQLTEAKPLHLGTGVDGHEVHEHRQLLGRDSL
eukprot:3687009-Prorocentrum_lima.AAC.1